MCGIIGALNLTSQTPVAAETLQHMLAMLRHRGPDGYGYYRDADVGLGNARLSIIDLATGDQPIGNEDGTLWIVFNGEIFNYRELRPELETRGHRFTTASDTEVILHLYEEEGPACLRRLNGQWAIAIWETGARRLFLARDRLGVRPLFYTVQAGRLVFGSEVKALLAHPGVAAAIDPRALAQVFTYWSPLSPRSVFRDIYEVPPGHYLLAQAGRVELTAYWTLDFAEEQPARPAADYVDEFEHLLIDAARLRLRADVPVGAYLSGGLDSSVTTAIIRGYTQTHLDTFSITFSDPEFDESQYQRQMVDFLGTDHHAVHCTHEDIGRIFPEVIWHTETPVLRTSPAPMLLLSRLVRSHQYKVVLTGEGADEMLAGYDIFKEAQIRRFWAKNPDSQIRPLLLQRLYPDIPGLSGRNAYLGAFFKKDLRQTDSPFYSHLIRWNNTARTRRFLLDDDGAGWTPDELHLPRAFGDWGPLAQAQYWEITTFLSSYLLSSQGDRMAMANSVEGRYPFLDHRVVEFCNRLPASMKLCGLREKWLLKQLGRKLVPETIVRRAKRPYRAPIHRSFFTSPPPDYVSELLSETALAQTEYFNPEAAVLLAKKVASGARLSEVEDMALVGILSTQLVDQLFVRGFRQADAALSPLKVVDRPA